MRSFFIIISILSVSLGALAQGDADKYSWKISLKIADDLFERGSYYNAIEYYEYALKVKPEDLQATYRNAESHRLVRDYKGAEEWYRKTLNLDAEKYPEAHFYYALMLKMNGKCEDAAGEFDIYQATGGDEQLKQRSQIERAGCDLQYQIKNDPDISVNNAGGNVNGVYPNFGAFPVSATEVVFSSVYSDTVVLITDTANYTVPGGYSKLYTAKRDGNKLVNPKPLPDHINGTVHAANGSFSPDGKLFFFTRCQTNEELENVCAIYVSRYDIDTWGDAQKLSPQINKEGSSSTQPTVMTDDNGEQVLIFSSNRSGGSGGYDLWVARFDDNLVFGSANNIGGTINTIVDEVTPFYDAVTGTLYFSSNGLIGLGGFDVYKTKMQGTNWQKPVNAGRPINSSVDDLYFTLFSNQQVGYLSSNRAGTLSLLSETTSEDIYTVSLVKKTDYVGYSYELGDSTLVPLTGVTYTLYKKNKDLGLYQKVDGFKPVLKDGQFDIELKAGEDYKITASKDKYLADTKYISSDDILKAGDSEKLYFKLDKISKDKTYTLNNIYYDYNSAKLRDSSTMVLDTLLALLQENPGIVIELSSHTDSRGSDKYNLDLSQDRAQSCVDYLISKGISEKRLVPKGYGEEKLLNKCDDGVKCSEEEHQINRRTEFRVIGELEEGVKVKN